MLASNFALCWWNMNGIHRSMLLKVSCSRGRGGLSWAVEDGGLSKGQGSEVKWHQFHVVF